MYLFEEWSCCGDRRRNSWKTSITVERKGEYNLPAVAKSDIRSGGPLRKEYFIPGPGWNKGEVSVFPAVIRQQVHSLLQLARPDPFSCFHLQTWLACRSKVKKHLSLAWRKSLREMAERLADKYEEAKEKQEDIMNRWAQRTPFHHSSPPALSHCAGVVAQTGGLGGSRHCCRASLTLAFRNATWGEPKEESLEPPRLGEGGQKHKTGGVLVCGKLMQPPLLLCAPRMKKVLRSFHSQLPVLSDSEKDMKKELQTIHDQLQHLSNAIRQVREGAGWLAGGW